MAVVARTDQARQATIGEALVAAKKTNRDDTLVETYNLLGDPAASSSNGPDGELGVRARARSLFGSERLDAIVVRASFRGRGSPSTQVDEKRQCHAHRTLRRRSARAASRYQQPPRDHRREGDRTARV